MSMLNLQHSVNVFEVYILLTVRNFEAVSYTSALFSFVCCPSSLLLFSCVFQETIQYSSFFPSFFITQLAINLVFEIMVYGVDILKVTALHWKMDPIMSSPLEPMMQLDFVTYWTHAVLKLVFLSPCGFSTLNMLKRVAIISIWTQPFELFTWNKCYKSFSVLFCLDKCSVTRRMFFILLFQCRHAYSIATYLMQLFYSTRRPCASCIIISSLNRHLPFCRSSSKTRN